MAAFIIIWATPSFEFTIGDIQKNVYVMNHTFPGAGVYQIVMSDPNRNEGIINIPESVTVVFTIRTIFTAGVH